MNTPRCEQIALADLADYAAGELAEHEAVAIEEHLFSCADCGARAMELDSLIPGIRSAVRSADVGGFVTDTVLNRLARDGVRVRTYTLSPGAVVPCAVWEDDELMALRLRGDFGGAGEVTLFQRVGGTEVGRAAGEIPASSHGELLYLEPAARVRQLPAAELEVVLTTHDRGAERLIASYTLVHGGVLHRR